MYVDCDQDTCSSLPGYAASTPGVLLDIVAATNSFTGSSTHTNGTGVVCDWDSAAGGLTGCSTPTP